MCDKIIVTEMNMKKTQTHTHTHGGGEDSSHEGLQREALWSKLCIRGHCSMKRETSLLLFITCTFKFKPGTGCVSWGMKCEIVTLYV